MNVSPHTTGTAHVDGKQSFFCAVCRKEFKRIDYLKRHRRTHTGERPYACSECDKSFSQSSHLATHMAVHSNEKPFACPVCKKRFKRSAHLKRHARTHTGERPYQCSICKKTFNQSTHLSTHTAVVHRGQKPFTCFCGKAFVLKGSFLRHSRLHDNSQQNSYTGSITSDVVDGMSVERPSTVASNGGVLVEPSVMVRGHEQQNSNGQQQSVCMASTEEARAQAGRLRDGGSNYTSMAWNWR